MAKTRGWTGYDDGDSFVENRGKEEQKHKRKTSSQLKTDKQNKNLLKTKTTAENEERAAESESLCCA